MKELYNLIMAKLKKLNILRARMRLIKLHEGIAYHDCVYCEDIYSWDLLLTKKEFIIYIKEFLQFKYGNHEL